MSSVRKTSGASRTPFKDFPHEHQHWFRSNQVYFLVARCRARFPAFASDEAKSIFWDRFNHDAACHGFRPWIVSLLDNHYHALGLLEHDRGLPAMMKSVHGSVAKLVNDLLERDRIPCPPHTEHGRLRRERARSDRKRNPDPPPDRPPPQLSAFRLLPFWRDAKRKNYFDGLLRDTTQLRRTWRYTLEQCRRHRICADPADYPHTRIYLPCEEALQIALTRNALLQGVPYNRYRNTRRAYP